MTSETPPQEPPRDKAELLARIRGAWAALEQVLNQLTHQRLAEQRDSHGWAVKDHLAHLAIWERSACALLRGAPRHLALGVERELYERGSFDEINDAIYAEIKDLSPTEVVALLHETHRELLAALEPLGEADLRKTYADLLPDDPRAGAHEPLLERLEGSTYGHYAEHLPWIQSLVEPRERHTGG